MGSLEAIGRTNTLRAVTGDITKLAQQMRQNEQTDRQLDMREKALDSDLASAALDRQQKKEQYQMQNKLVPLSIAQEAFPVPEVAQYATKIATALGLVEEVHGVPSIKAGGAQHVYKLLHEGEHPEIISGLTVNHYRNKVGQIKDQLAELQQSGKDLSKDKNALALQQALQQAERGLFGAIEQAGQLQEYNKLTKDYTPQSVEEFMKIGEQSVLVERPKTADGKRIEKVIDLGDKQRVYYTDGTEEDLKKSATPTSIANSTARTPREEMAMRKEFQSLPEVKSYPIIEKQALRLDKAMEEMRSGGTLIAVDQALIQILNKMLDETSVVRESEYARTPSDQALISRIRGKFEKIKTGGAGLTNEEREAIYRMAQLFKGVAQQQYNEQVDYYSALAERYNYDPRNIVRLGGKKVGKKTAENYLSKWD